MKLEEIKEQLNQTKADFYPHDRKRWFEAFEVREIVEDKDGDIDE